MSNGGVKELGMIGRSAVLCVRPPDKDPITTTICALDSCVTRITGSKGWKRVQGCNTKI